MQATCHARKSKHRVDLEMPKAARLSDATVHMQPQATSTIMKAIGGGKTIPGQKQRGVKRRGELYNSYPKKQ